MTYPSLYFFMKLLESFAHAYKVMGLFTFFNVKDIVHSEFLPHNQTIDQQVYKEILHCLLCSGHEKRQELWQDKPWLLHHISAPAFNTPWASSSSWNNLSSSPYLLLCVEVKSILFLKRFNHLYFQQMQPKKEGKFLRSYLKKFGFPSTIEIGEGWW